MSGLSLRTRFVPGFCCRGQKGLINRIVLPKTIIKKGKWYGFQKWTKKPNVEVLECSQWGKVHFPQKWPPCHTVAGTTSRLQSQCSLASLKAVIANKLYEKYCTISDISAGTTCTDTESTLHLLWVSSYFEHCTTAIIWRVKHLSNGFVSCPHWL